MITLLNLKIDFEQFNVLDDVEVTAVDANGVVYTVTGLRFTRLPGYKQPLYLLDIEPVNNVKRAQLELELQARQEDIVKLQAELDTLPTVP